MSIGGLMAAGLVALLPHVGHGGHGLSCPGTAVTRDDYLWEIYKKTPKEDASGAFERKDEEAAQMRGMSLREYVIGGMSAGFKERLYRMLQAMELRGLSPGITSAFRDDFRQSLIKKGVRSPVGRSFHGGSLRGGYGHGVAADIIAIAPTLRERWKLSPALWKWIDEYGKRFGLGRPYGNRDAPHVAPLDGKEYALKKHAKHRKLAKKKLKSKVASAWKKTKKKLRLASRK